MKKIMNLCLRNNKVIISLMFIMVLSTINTLEGIVLSEFGFSYFFLVSEFISLIITIFFIHFIMCMVEEGKCTTMKKD
jgi:antibiotic biosynthesis monooxygenase (ABM) superfamily enzyme